MQLTTDCLGSTPNRDLKGGAAMKYTYTFDVWPNEVWGFNRALFDVFRLLTPRVELPFTEEEFERFKSMLWHDGFRVTGVVRVPYNEPEVVL